MKKSKLIIIIAISLVVVMSGIAGFIIFFNKKEDSKSTPTPTQTQTEIPQPYTSDVVTNETDTKKLMDYTNYLILNGASMNELRKAFNTEGVGHADILTGDDSYLRLKPSDELIERHELSDYVKKASSYATRVEEKIKANFAYELVDVEANEAGNAVMISVKVKAYLYKSYLSDLNGLQNKLLEEAGRKKLLDSYRGGEMSDELTVAMYKAKVKAMEILDKYLDDYANNEYVNLNMPLEDGRKDTASLYTYFSLAGGMSSSKSNSMPQPQPQSIETRVSTYMSNATKDGILDKSNPLKLK